MQLKQPHPLIQPKILGKKILTTSVTIVKADLNWSAIWKKHNEHKHKEIQKPEELCDEEVYTSLNMSAASEERSNVSFILNDSFDKIGMKSNHELWDQLEVTGECGFCEYTHPLSYRSQDERIMCQQYPNQDREQYDHMETYHKDVVDMLDEYWTSAAKTVLSEDITVEIIQMLGIVNSCPLYAVLYFCNVNWLCKRLITLWEWYQFDILFSLCLEIKK